MRGIPVRFFQTLMVIWMLRCCVGNNSGFKVDEPALGQWVRVLRKGRQNRKDVLKNSILSEATKKSSFSLGQIPGAADPVSLQQVCSLERMLRVKTRTEEKAKIAGLAATARATAGTIGLLEVHESGFSEVARTAGAAATTGESVGIIGLRQVMESDVARLSYIHESSLAHSYADVGAFGAGVFCVWVCCALCCCFAC